MERTSRRTSRSPSLAKHQLGDGMRTTGPDPRRRWACRALRHQRLHGRRGRRAERDRAATTRPGSRLRPPRGALRRRRPATRAVRASTARHDRAPAGTLVVRAARAAPRGARRWRTDTTVLVIGGKPGAAGPPSPFEYWYLAGPGVRRAVRLRAAAYEIAAEGLDVVAPGRTRTLHVQASPVTPRSRGSAVRGRSSAPRDRVRRRRPGDPRVGGDDSDLDSSSRF